MPHSPQAFEDILESCIAAIERRNQTVEECLARYPEQSDQLEPLLRLAVRLQLARAVAAPPAFHQVAAIRMQNMIASSSRLSGQQPIGRRPASGFAKVFGSRRLSSLPVALSGLILFLLLLGSGTVYASNRALPGDLLYPLKTATENIQLALVPSQEARAELRLNLAGRRLDEATRLVDKERPEQAQAALIAYARQVEDALNALADSDRLSQERRQRLARQLERQLALYQKRLAALRKRSTTVTAAVQSALDASQTGLAKTQRIGGGSTPNNPTGPDGQPVVPPALGVTSTPTATPVATRTPTRTPGRPIVTSVPRPPDLPTARPTGRPIERPPLPVPTALPTRRPPALPTDLPTALPTHRPTRTPLPTAWPTPPIETPMPWPTEWPTVVLPTVTVTVPAIPTVTITPPAAPTITVTPPAVPTVTFTPPAVPTVTFTPPAVPTVTLTPPTLPTVTFTPPAVPSIAPPATPPIRRTPRP